MSNITLVTGIWDLGRSSLSEGWSRSFQHYIDHFTTLLKNTKRYNLVIFIDPSREHIVWDHRDRSNTAVYHHPIESFSGNFFPFRNQIESIRTNDKWINQVGWLKDSTQARLPLYNPMVMSKMFLLHNARIYDPFNSQYYFWIDGGITNTVHPGYFSQDGVLEKLVEDLKEFIFVCFPYETSSEIHGFDIEAMKKYSRSATVNRVARGGFFGGKASTLAKANELYYSLLQDTLHNGYMGTEESIFTIMTYLDTKTFKTHMIDENGLINKFFEDIKNTSPKYASNKISKNKNIQLYLNTFNSPEQFKMVIDSFLKHDSKFLYNTEKILINNSTNPKYDSDYNLICKEFDFSQIKNGNMGVCGARQFAAEKFFDSQSQYMLFFEDDMLLDYESKCNFGFIKSVDNLFDNIVSIMDEENYDFLKLSFSEFYGHNGQQWSWHNVPLAKKQEYFGDIGEKPPTVFRHIKSLNSVVYADGEVYYSNWPHIIGQEGNKKMFLDTKWAHPFEQTWMSHIYTLTKESIVNPSILLSSPITHNRIHFYEGSERKEN